MNISAKGRWEVPIFESRPAWNVNYSSILTQLIQDAGRYTEDYASDLFILWSYLIERELNNPNWQGGTYMFGFRECGVDKKETIEYQIQYPYYYRKVRTLNVVIDGNNIEMELF